MRDRFRVIVLTRFADNSKNENELKDSQEGGSNVFYIGRSEIHLW